MKSSSTIIDCPTTNPDTLSGHSTEHPTTHNHIPDSKPQLPTQHPTTDNQQPS
ncbi:MAG: hypothetical protein KA797_03870 [Chitinophagales bacterium]|nr:hypothetical protein [Chitinophagales bacterium]